MFSRQLFVPTNTSLSEWATQTWSPQHLPLPGTPWKMASRGSGTVQTSDRHLLAAAYYDQVTKPAPCDSKDHPKVLKPCLKCYAQAGRSLVVELCLACVRLWLCSSAIGRRRGRGNPATAAHIKNKAENYFFPRHGYSSIRGQLTWQAPETVWFLSRQGLTM